MKTSEAAAAASAAAAAASGVFTVLNVETVLDGIRLCFDLKSLHLVMLYPKSPVIDEEILLRHDFYPTLRGEQQI